MKKNKNRTKGKGLMAIGLALVLAAAGMTGWNLWEDRSAGASAQELLLHYDVVQTEPVQETEDAEEPQEADAEEASAEPKAASRTESAEALSGVLSIPSLQLTLPVFEDWSYSKLKKAPCRYAGSAEEGTLVLCAHNYKSHFGRLKQLHVGDTVIFTDWSGVAYAYRVAEMETLQPTAIEELLSGEYPLSLVTCTKGGTSRFVVRCDAE